MKLIKRFLCCAAVGSLGLMLTACGDENAMSKKEMDSIKNSPKMTADDWDKVGAGMKKGAEARSSSQAEWAKKNPEEVARINAERAKAGKPPLGG